MTREKIEKMEVGNNTDIAVAENVMKWKHISENEPVRLHWQEGGYICNGVAYTFQGTANRSGKIFLPSRDDIDALEVAEKFDNFSIARAWKLNIGSEDWRGYSAWLALGPEAVSALAETIPLAICRAALMLKTP